MFDVFCRRREGGVVWNPLVIGTGLPPVSLYNPSNINTRRYQKIPARATADHSCSDEAHGHRGRITELG